MTFTLHAKQTKFHIFSIALGLPYGSKIVFIVRAIQLNGAILSPSTSTTAPIRKLIVITPASDNIWASGICSLLPCSRQTNQCPALLFKSKTQTMQPKSRPGEMENTFSLVCLAGKDLWHSGSNALENGIRWNIYCLIGLRILHCTVLYCTVLYACSLL